MPSVKSTYDKIAKTLHWLTAFAIIIMLVIGWVMTSETLPNGPTKFAMYQWHKSVGITILVLSLLRLIWRIANPPPPLPSSMKRWEIIAAKVSHLCFYALMVGLPFIGWAMSSVSQYKTTLFGIITLPNIPLLSDLDNKKGLQEIFGEAHEILAYIMTSLLALHVFAAGKHHFINKDDVLLRMTPIFTNKFLRNLRGGM